MKKEEKIGAIIFALLFIAILDFFLGIGTSIIKLPLAILVMVSLVIQMIILKAKKINKKMNKSISFYFWSVFITIFISAITFINYSLNPPSPQYLSKIIQDIIFVSGTIISIIILLAGIIMDKNKK